MHLNVWFFYKTNYDFISNINLLVCQVQLCFKDLPVLSDWAAAKLELYTPVLHHSEMQLCGIAFLSIKWNWDCQFQGNPSNFKMVFRLTTTTFLSMLQAKLLIGHIVSKWSVLCLISIFFYYHQAILPRNTYSTREGIWALRS